ncbi:hypothetical protein SASPL_102363 [Salvia splendens]|uniref:Uncharacterized protein n=1 Tax=Salvia splendens TaxID=180675 RepID=A0A8X8ZZZ7_SALSN|nr:hypothetical protein SASPL_113983 [Salvia splendens]KAG6437446.1 hypothetical protein SASPL_102363 [Salvia splendens]
MTQWSRSGRGTPSSVSWFLQHLLQSVDPAQKLYTTMRLWEFPDQYLVEPTDGSSASILAVSHLDGSMNLIGNFIP